MSAPIIRAAPWILITLIVVVAGCSRASTSLPSAGRGAESSASSCPRHASLVPVATKRLRRGIGAVVAEEGFVFVANPVVGTLTRVSGGSSTVIHLSPGPMSLTVYDGRLWVSQRDANTVISMSTQSLHRLTTSHIPAPVDVVAGPFGVWVLSIDTAALYQINPGSGMNFAPRDSPAADPTEMVAAGEELWVLGAGEQGLSPFNAKLGRIVRAGFRLAGESMSGLSANEADVWLGEPRTRAILHVNIGAMRLERTAAPGRMAVASTAIAQCGVWVASPEGKLGLIAPGSGISLATPMQVSSTIAALTTSGGDAWVTDPVNGTLTRVSLQEARAGVRH